MNHIIKKIIASSFFLFAVHAYAQDDMSSHDLHQSDDRVVFWR